MSRIYKKEINWSKNKKQNNLTLKNIYHPIEAEKNKTEDLLAYRESSITPIRSHVHITKHLY
jgi:hypothetical protein